MHGRVLVIAGSDSGGGAGIQADIKTITAFGAYAATAITAATAQNTHGVDESIALPAPFVQKQIAMVLDDIGADAIKIGMLANADIAHAVASILEQHTDIPVVLDPVMIAKGGASLLDKDAISVIKERLIPLATLVTPNSEEAEALTGVKINNRDEMIEAGLAICDMDAKATLIKGGHMDGDDIEDVLVMKNREPISIKTARISTPHTHGTGCSYASAMAALLAQGHTLTSAMELAHTYIQHAIATAPGYGGGHGPLNHCHAIEKTLANKA